MQNLIWSIHGQVYECAQCENYIPGDRIRTKCLGCRHEYDAHTDEESAEMDYPKPDLFKYRTNTETAVDRERVIKGLESCSPSYPRLIQCAGCPYEKNCLHNGRNETLLKEALKLLKEQK